MARSSSLRIAVSCRPRRCCWLLWGVESPGNTRVDVETGDRFEIEPLEVVAMADPREPEAKVRLIDLI